MSDTSSRPAPTLTLNATLLSSCQSLWIASADAAAKDLPLAHTMGDVTVAPIPTFHREAVIEGFALKEFEDYLRYGMVHKGVFEIDVSSGAPALKTGKDLSVIMRDRGGKVELDDAFAINLMITRAEQLLSTMNAMLGRGFQVGLQDWKYAEGVERDNTQPALDIITIQAEKARILITTRDTRKIDLEIEEGDLRAYAAERDDGKESTVKLRIPPRGDISVDMSDYSNEPRVSDDEADLDV